MFKTAALSVLGLVIGMASSVANAQFYHDPVGYSYAPRPVYSAPIMVGYSLHYQAVPVVVSRPVYVTPVVHTVYTTPVYVALVPVSRVVSPPAVVCESLKVRPNSTTYRAQGDGYSVHERSTPHRTVTRIRSR